MKYVLIAIALLLILMALPIVYVAVAQAPSAALEAAPTQPADAPGSGPYANTGFSNGPLTSAAAAQGSGPYANTAAITADQLAAFVPPDGITAEAVEVEGDPGLRLTNTRSEPVSVTVVELPVHDPAAKHFLYAAEMSSENLAGSAYLEMYAVVAGNAYFSRALNDRFSGTSAIRMTTTPFFLTGDQAMESARLGVRFEGPGTVTLSQLSLTGGPAPSGGPTHWPGIAGGIFGLCAGIWGAIAGILGARGRARGPVLAITLLFAIAGAIALTFGLVLLSGRAERTLWFPLVNLGGVALPVFGAAYFVLRHRYREAEERRMMAMDLH
jgi:hypothetical protein